MKEIAQVPTGAPVIPNGDERHHFLIPGLSILIFLVVGFSIAFVIQRKRDIAFEKYYREQKVGEYAGVFQQLAGSEPIRQGEGVDVFGALSQSTQSVSDIDMSVIFETLNQAEKNDRKDSRKQFKASRSL